MAKVWIPPGALQHIVMPDVSIYDATPNPVMVELRQAPLRRKCVLEVPVDLGTHRRLTRVRRFHAAAFWVGLPSMVIVLGIGLWNLAMRSFRPDVPEPVPLIQTVAISVLLLSYAAIFATLLLDRPAIEFRGGGVIVKHVHPRAAWYWVAANPPGCVNILHR